MVVVLRRTRRCRPPCRKHQGCGLVDLEGGRTQCDLLAASPSELYEQPGALIALAFSTWPEDAGDTPRIICFSGPHSCPRPGSATAAPKGTVPADHSGGGLIALQSTDVMRRAHSAENCLRSKIHIRAG